MGSANPALCLTKGSNQNTTRRHRGHWESPGCRVLWLWETRGWDQNEHLAFQGNVPHTGWRMRAASKEWLLTFLPKLDCLSWTSTVLKWAQQRETLVDGQGCCRELLASEVASLGWTLPLFPKMEMPPEGACCGRCNFSRWFPRDSSKFF